MDLGQREAVGIVGDADDAPGFAAQAGRERQGLQAGNVCRPDDAGIGTFHPRDGDVERHVGPGRAERRQGADKGRGIIHRSRDGAAVIGPAIGVDHREIDERSADICAKNHERIHTPDWPADGGILIFRSFFVNRQFIVPST
ncbi:hypothetical protein AA12717_3347 [Gluconacetobacter sacchari DSM 12717]|uniref:Uncharacterized protein n=2 Tax=Gluconacetobacter sacchari TaxID=92759 RepID=A0A7W4NSM9_9PROT|nr:hypothetical protein [Gluconacetobacter sacchari]MBB2161370.1 hypothetical protein [Gluconacetobacter sacchari]GBQ29712.1 hypothetical protein AA12717_3347 [Gluconacetobacter sacchari DSM 12717]